MKRGTGADVNVRAYDDTTALYLATNNQMPFVRALIEAKADARIGPFKLRVQAEGKLDSPLMYAASHHSDDNVGRLEVT